MIRKDDRTPDQQKTHTALVTATDKCLSGWGQAEKGLSKCAWACKPKHFDKVFKWVQNRSDMKYVRYQVKDWYPKNCVHLHIYVVDDNHPALV